MDSLFSKELALGRISMVQTKPRCVHPTGRVPKKDSGKSRPITDCSRPHGISLNDHIKRDLESFRMNSIDSAVSFSTPYCFYSIVYIESAWRWIPVFPPHPELQGFRWMFGTHDSSQYHYYVDNRLCFGLSCAPFIFNRISNAIVRMMARRGFRAVVNYRKSSIKPPLSNKPPLFRGGKLISPPPPSPSPNPYSSSKKLTINVD